MRQVNSYISFSFLCSLFVMLGFAQNVSAQKALNAAQKQRQQVVRQAYADAQAYAEQQKKDRYTGNVFTAKWQRNESAVGHVEETIEFFSKDKEDGRTGMSYHSLLLVRNSYKRSEATIGDTYEEFLFNPDNGNLMFYFKTNNYWWCEEEVKVETRYYFNADGSFSSGSLKLTPINGQKQPFYPEELQELDGNDALMMQERYKRVFNSMTNFTTE